MALFGVADQTSQAAAVAAAKAAAVAKQVAGGPGSTGAVDTTPPPTEDQVGLSAEAQAALAAPPPATETPPPAPAAAEAEAAAQPEETETEEPTEGSDGTILEPGASEEVDGDLPVADTDEPPTEAAEFCRLVDLAIGPDSHRMQGSGQAWLESTLTGPRGSTIHLDNEWRIQFAAAIGVDPEEVTEEVVDQLFGNGDGVLDEDVELSVINDRLEQLLPQIQVRQEICNESLINILASDRIAWIDQNEAASDVDIVALGQAGDEEIYNLYLRIALQAYVDEAPNETERGRRRTEALSILNGTTTEIPEPVRRNLRYAYMAGLDYMLTIHHLELDEDLDFTDPEVRQNFLQGLFALYVQNGDLPVNDPEFKEACSHWKNDVIDEHDLEDLAAYRRAHIPVEEDTIPTPEDGAAPAAAGAAETPETPAAPPVAPPLAPTVETVA